MMKKALLILFFSSVFLHFGNAQDESLTIEQWRTDIQYLKDELHEKHVALYRNIDKATLGSKFEEVFKYLNDLGTTPPDHYRMVRSVFEIVASIRDNHTTIHDRYDTFTLLPFLAKWFQNDLYITVTSKNNEALIGAKIIRVNGHEIAKVSQDLKRIVPHSNELGFKDTMPYYLRNPQLLRGFDIIDQLNSASITLELLDGRIIEHEFLAVSLKEYRKSTKVYASSKNNSKPLFLRDPNKNYWFEYLPENHLLYLRYRRALNTKGQKANEFWELLFKFIDLHEIEKLAIDLRGNSGGRPDLAIPLVAGIKSRRALNHRGKLFTIIDGGTESAGITLATHLESHTNTLMVGEGIGDRPNHLSDARISKLPNSKIKVGIPILHYLNTHEHDDRWNIIPHIPVQYTFDHYLEGIDPYLNAIFSYEEVDNRNDEMLPQSLLGEYDFHVNQTLHLEHRDGQNYVRLSNGWETPLFQVEKDLYRTKLLDNYLKIDEKGLMLITGEAQEILLPKRTTTSVVVPQEMINRNDFEQAKRAYQKLYEEYGDIWPLQRNNLSYQALRLYYETSNFEKSRILMDINLALHPGIGFVNISYGNLFQAHGQGFKSFPCYIKGMLKGYKD